MLAVHPTIEEEFRLTACNCAERRLDPFGSQTELVFPWAGVLVLRGDYETYADVVAQKVLLVNGLELHDFHHGTVHFLQALGSPLLQNHGLRLLRAAQAAVSAAGRGFEVNDAAARDFHREEHFLAQQHSSGLSCVDLLESAAELEANRLDIGAGAADGVRLGRNHRALLERMHPDPASPRRRAFDFLTGRLGDDDACDLMALLTFLAFIGNDPCAAFIQLAEWAADEPEAWKSLTAAQMIDRLGFGDQFEEYWDAVAAGEPLGTPYVVDPLREAMRRLGRSLLLEVLGRPAFYLPRLDEPQLRAVLPPVMIFPSREGGLVHHLNGVALDVNPAFAGNALAEVAVYGAAQRLTLDRRVPIRNYCNHDGCQHHRSSLCHRWYRPPNTHEGHDTCHFVRVFAHYAGIDPAAAWNRSGGARGGPA